MTGEFKGWPRAAFDVLLQLEGEPSVETRERFRQAREALVRQPMIDLLNSVADADEEYEDFSVWGYGKMLRPWQRQGSIIRLARNVELAIRFDLDGLEVCLAWWYAPAEQIQRYRLAVADADSGRRLDAILLQLERDGFTVSGDVMKRLPRGYHVDHPRAKSPRHRSLIASQPLGCEEWLHTDAVVDRVLSAFSMLQPLSMWLVENVADPQ